MKTGFTSRTRSVKVRARKRKHSKRVGITSLRPQGLKMKSKFMTKLSIAQK